MYFIYEPSDIYLLLWIIDHIIHLNKWEFELKWRYSTPQPFFASKIASLFANEQKKKMLFTFALLLLLLFNQNQDLQEHLLFERFTDCCNYTICIAKSLSRVNSSCVYTQNNWWIFCIIHIFATRHNNMFKSTPQTKEMAQSPLQYFLMTSLFDQMWNNV